MKRLLLWEAWKFFNLVPKSALCKKKGGGDFLFFSVNLGFVFWEVLSLHYSPWPHPKCVVRSLSFQWAIQWSQSFLASAHPGLVPVLSNLPSEWRTVQGPMHSRASRRKDPGSLSGKVTYRRRGLRWTLIWGRNDLSLCLGADMLGLMPWAITGFCFAVQAWDFFGSTIVSKK